jgi:hypothetical protein
MKRRNAFLDARFAIHSGDEKTPHDTLIWPRRFEWCVRLGVDSRMDMNNTVLIEIGLHVQSLTNGGPMRIL